MAAVEKELQRMGNIKKAPHQTTEEFLKAYKQYKMEKAKMLDTRKEMTEKTVEV